MLLVGYPKVIPYTKFEHFRIIRFWTMLQINKQTQPNMLPTPTDSVGVGDWVIEWVEFNVPLIAAGRH